MYQVFSSALRVGLRRRGLDRVGRRLVWTPPLLHWHQLIAGSRNDPPMILTVNRIKLVFIELALLKTTVYSVCRALLNMSFLDEIPSQTPAGGGDQHALSSSVSNPEHQGYVRSRITDYLVTTKFANASEALVRRTWEDFEWIQERLVQERAGIIVPVLPQKKPVTSRMKFDDEFVHERQAAMHRFLQRIVGHPELVDAPSLLLFFTQSPTDWEATKEAAKKIEAAEMEASNHTSVNDTEGEEAHTVVISAAEQVGAPKKKGLLGKWMSAKRDQWALRSKNLILEETPKESKKFDEMQVYADHLETCIRILAEDAKALKESQQGASEKFKTMGAAFNQLWGEHELSNMSSSTMYQTVGDCWANLCKSVEKQCGFGHTHLEKPLEELVLDIVALKAAISKRKKVVYDYTKKVQEGRKMQQQMDRMRVITDLSAASDQYFALERDLRISDAEVEERKKFKELITDRLSRDIERFRVEWHERMRQVLETFHKEQVMLLTDQSKLWESPLPILAKVNDGRSALPTGAKKVVAPELSILYNTSGATASFANGNGDANLIPESPTSYPVEPATPTDGAPGLPSPKTHDSIDSMDSVTLDESLPMGAPPPAAAPPPPPTEDSGPKIASV